MLSDKMKAFCTSALVYLFFGIGWGLVVATYPENETLQSMAFTFGFLISFVLTVATEVIYKVTFIEKSYPLALLVGIFIFGSLVFAYSGVGLFFGFFAVALAGILYFF